MSKKAAPNHLKATSKGPVFHVQGTREELLQLKSALTLMLEEEHATADDYARVSGIGETIKGQRIGVWEIDDAAPVGYTAQPLL